MTIKTDRVRRVATRVVVFVAALLITVSTVVVWSTRTALNSDRFAKTVETSLDDERVTTALTTYITTQITTAIDLKQIAADIIPGQRDLLAGPLADAATKFINERVSAIVTSDRFAAWFAALVETVHNAAIHLAKGESGPVINSDDGSVVINVAPAIGAVLTQLGADGLVDRIADMPSLDQNPKAADVITRIATALNIQVPENFGQITVLQSDDLARLQDTFRTFRMLVWVLVIISLVLAVGSILASKDRRKALIDLGIGIIVSSAIVWILFARIGAKATKDKPAAAAIFEVLRDSLLKALAITALLAAILVLVEWYRGPRWHPVPAEWTLISTVVASTIIWVTVTFMTPPTDRATLISFYKLVRPAGPGWSAVRAEAGVGPSPDSLTVSLAGWVIGCTFVYSALFGTGSFLYGKTNIGFAWLAVFIVSGIGLVKVFKLGSTKTAA